MQVPEVCVANMFLSVYPSQMCPLKLSIELDLIFCCTISLSIIIVQKLLDCVPSDEQDTSGGTLQKAGDCTNKSK